MKIFDIIFLPIRLLSSHEMLNKLGLRSLRDERIDIVIKYCKGRVLDIGCGDNQLIRKYNQKYNQNSIGVDIFDFGNGALIVEDSSRLPFSNKSFQIVIFVSSFQYIPNYQEVIKETHRVLDDNGIVLITVLSPIIGFIRNRLTWWDEDRNKIELEKGQRYGLSYKEIYSSLKEDFILIKRKRFILGLNSLYVFKKKNTKERN